MIKRDNVAHFSSFWDQMVVSSLVWLFSQHLHSRLPKEDMPIAHALFGHTRVVHFIWPSKCTTFYIFLATAYWEFCTLIWSLTKLLQTRLKLPISYIYRTIIYVHVILHRQNLNFPKLFGLEVGRVSKTFQTVLRESSATRNVRVLHFFHFSCSTECWQSSFCLLKWHFFL